MRFTRFQRIQFRDTSRKRAAFERKKRLEREAMPLFAEEIASGQVDTSQEMTGRAKIWNDRQQRDRLQRAAKWREGRRRLQTYPEPVRMQLLAYWQRCRWPADPVYLLTMLHMFNEGRLELDPKPYQPITPSSKD